MDSALINQKSYICYEYKILVILICILQTSADEWTGQLLEDPTTKLSGNVENMNVNQHLIEDSTDVRKRKISLLLKTFKKYIEMYI